VRTAVETWSRSEGPYGAECVELVGGPRGARVEARFGRGADVARESDRLGFHRAAALLRDADRSCYLSIFYVPPAARRAEPGVGIRLLRSLLDMLRADGCARVVTHVFVRARADHRRTVAFMERAGFSFEAEHERTMPLAFLDLGAVAGRRDNPSAENLALLRYLEDGVNPEDFLHLLPSYFRSTRRDPPEGFDPRWPQGILDDPAWQEEIADEFREWISTDAIDELRANKMNSPAYVFLEDPELLDDDTWLVHFSPSAAAVAKHGFLYGFPSMKRLAFTRRSASGNGAPGWNYAYRESASQADDVAEIGAYGNGAVLFRSGGVEAFHTGDGERQVIFWGPLVREFILVEHAEEDDVWLIRDRRNGRVLKRSDWRSVMKWATSNAGPKRDAIVRPVREGRARAKGR